LVCAIAVVTFAGAALYLATPLMHADMISPVTTAVLGALGALVIAYLNSFLKEKYVRHLDAAAIAAGLVGELSSYAGAAPEIRKALDFYEAAVHGKYRDRIKFRAFDRPKDVFYEANAAKLGLPGADLVRDVVYVYGNLGGFRTGFGMPWPTAQTWATKNFSEGYGQRVMLSIEHRSAASHCWKR
jgi:hypothetical protein